MNDLGQLSEKEVKFMKAIKDRGGNLDEAVTFIKQQRGGATTQPVPTKVETNKAGIPQGIGAGLATTAGVLGAAKIAGEGLKKVGKFTYGLTLPPTTAEAGAIQAYEAGVLKNLPKTTVQTALDQPILQRGGRTVASKLGQMGTRSQIGVQSVAKAKELGTKKIEPFFQKAAELGKGATYEDLKQNAIDDIMASTKYSVQKKADIIEEINGLFAGLEGETDLKNLDLQAREIRNKLPAKYMQGVMPTEALKDAQKTVSQVMKSKVYTTAKELGDDVAKAYIDYGNLKGLGELGKKAMTQAGRKGGTGTLISYIVDELATPITTTVGKLTYKTGQAISAIPNAVYNKIRSAPKAIKGLIKSGAIAPAVSSALVGDKIPGAYAQKAFESYINYEKSPSKYKTLKGGYFKAVSNEDYEKYKEKDGSIVFPDGSKYNKEGVYVGKIL